MAVLAAGALVAMWDRSRDSVVWSVALAASLVGTAALAAVLLDRASGFVPFLAPAVMVIAVLGACVLLLARVTPALGSTSVRNKVALVAAAAGLVAMLARSDRVFACHGRQGAERRRSARRPGQR